MKDRQYKDLSIKEFTRAASVYDSGHAGIYELCKDDYPPILSELEKISFQTLLDVGCGTGPMIERLSKKYPDKQYTGLDLTPKMIEVANEKNCPIRSLLSVTVKTSPLNQNLSTPSFVQTVFIIIPIHKSSLTA